MRATLNGHQVVDVLEVGRLSSRVRYRRGQDGDTVTMWARNLELDPEPCGACLGKGCKACESRGHSPRKSQAVTSLVEAVEKLAVVATVGLGVYAVAKHIEQRRIDPKKVERDFIDAGKCPKCTLEMHEGECP
jgi:hypothetical protein